MITKYHRRSLAFGIPGAMLKVGSFPLLIMLTPNPGNHTQTGPAWVGTLFLSCLLLGFALWIVAVFYYAMAKGYRAVFGFLGIFSFLGLLILFLLPDRANEPVPSA